MGNLHSGSGGDAIAGVQVAVKAQEFETGCLDPQPMPFFENVTGGSQLDAKFIHFARLQKINLLKAAPISVAFRASR
jgi:hypothetical protein